MGEVGGGLFGVVLRGLNKRICGVVFVGAFSVCAFFFFNLIGVRVLQYQNKTKKPFRTLWGFYFVLVVLPLFHYVCTAYRYSDSDTSFLMPY